MTSPIWRALEGSRRARGGEPVLGDVRAHTRTELSAISLENAVAKSANALLEEFDIEPGDLIGVELPPHWQRVVWSLAAWTVGAVVVPGSGDGVALLVTHAEAIPGDAQVRVGVVSLHPLGLTERLIDGTESLTDLVRLAPDALLAPAVEDSAAALALGVGRHLTQGEVLSWAQERLDHPGRVLIVPDDLPMVDGWILPAIGPLLPGRSVVITEPMNDMDSVIRSERIDWSLPAPSGM